MSKSYWLPIVALGGCLAFTSLSFSQEGVNVPAKAEAQAEQTAAPQQTPPTTAPTATQNPFVYQPDCERPGDSAAADYCQQRSMAFSAIELVGLTGLQVWLSAVGIFALGVSLFFTWKAVRVAEDSVAVARDNAKDELRAYVAVTFGEIQVAGGQCGGNVFIKNYGQTPAMNIRWVTPSARIIPRRSHSIFDFKEPEHKDFTLQPGREINGGFGADLATRTTLRALLSEEMEIHIWGTVKYEDIYKRTHTTHYRFKSHGGDFKRRIAYPTMSDNDAT